MRIGEAARKGLERVIAKRSACGVALKPDSTGFKILKAFVEGGAGRRSEYQPPPFFDGVRMAARARPCGP